MRYVCIRSKHMQLESAKVRRSTCLRTQVTPQLRIPDHSAVGPRPCPCDASLKGPRSSADTHCRNLQVDGAKTGLQLLKQSHQNISDISETLDNVSSFAKGDRGAQKVQRMEELAKECTLPSLCTGIRGSQPRQASAHCHDGR